MEPLTFTQDIGIWLAAILTLCVYSFLIKDNFMFKLTEAIFIGVSVGYSVVMTYQQALKPKIEQPIIRYFHNLSVDSEVVSSNIYLTVSTLANQVAIDPTANFDTNNYLKTLDNALHSSTIDLRDSNKLRESLKNKLLNTGLSLSNAPAMLVATQNYLDNDYKKTRVSQHFWFAYIIFSLLLGLLYLSRFSPKRAWLSRFPMAYLMGIGVGIGVPLAFQTQILGQIKASIIPIVFKLPNGSISWGLTCGNIALLLGFLSVLYYFFFSLKKTDIVSRAMTKVGVGYLMLGFGASFAFTIMARISLLTGRVEFLQKEWLQYELMPLWELIKFWN